MCRGGDQVLDASTSSEDAVEGGGNGSVSDERTGEAGSSAIEGRGCGHKGPALHDAIADEMVEDAEEGEVFVDSQVLVQLQVFAHPDMIIIILPSTPIHTYPSPFIYHQWLSYHPCLLGPVGVTILI